MIPDPKIFFLGTLPRFEQSGARGAGWRYVPSHAGTLIGRMLEEATIVIDAGHEPSERMWAELRITRAKIVRL